MGCCCSSPQRAPLRTHAGAPSSWNRTFTTVGDLSSCQQREKFTVNVTTGRGHTPQAGCARLRAAHQSGGRGSRVRHTDLRRAWRHACRPLAETCQPPPQPPRRAGRRWWPQPRPQKWRLAQQAGASGTPTPVHAWSRDAPASPEPDRPPHRRWQGVRRKARRPPRSPGRADPSRPPQRRERIRAAAWGREALSAARH